jgi:hypothetical protein
VGREAAHLVKSKAGPYNTRGTAAYDCRVISPTDLKHIEALDAKIRDLTALRAKFIADQFESWRLARRDDFKIVVNAARSCAPCKIHAT